MEKIKTFRKQLDKLDKRIIFLLEKRFKVVKKIKNLKEKQNLPRKDLKRENQIKRSFEKSFLYPEFIDEFFDLIFEYSFDKMENSKKAR